MVAKIHSFPVWLQGSKAEQAAEAQRQALTLASFTRAHQTEEERLIGRGHLLEVTARGNLERAKRRDKQARILAQDQLADALAMQGKYAEAATTHTNAQRRRYFREIIKALEKPDNARCKCKDRKAKINGTEISITPRFERARLFSPIHKRVVSLVECSKCGDLNARPVVSRLLQHQGALAQNEAAARRENARFVNDVQVLGK